jgi:hypothetical protein
MGSNVNQKYLKKILQKFSVLLPSYNNCLGGLCLGCSEGFSLGEAAGWLCANATPFSGRDVCLVGLGIWRVQEPIPCTCQGWLCKKLSPEVEMRV